MADDDSSEAGDTGPVATVIHLGDRRDDPPVPPSPVPDADGSVEASAETPAVLVDQRMRRRRIAVRRDEGLRRLRRVAWLLTPFTALVSGAVLVHMPWFDVDRITVEGTQMTNPVTVEWASRIDRGDTMATFDEHGAEGRVEHLPWVAEADVIRQWPSTVRIVVTERQPAAVIFRGEVPDEGEQDDGATPPVLVDASGRVLDIGGAVPAGLVAVTGVDGLLREGGTLPSSAVPALELAVGLGQRLPGTALSVSLDLDAHLAAGGVARFGTIDQLEEKLIALETVLSDVDVRGLALLDLRVPSSPAIRRD